jgi:hypothetical protein
MSDRALLELAAKAAGYAGLGSWDEKMQCLWDGEGWSFDPLQDDGDALRLACKLNLKVDLNFGSGIDERPGIGVWTAVDNAHFPQFWTASPDDICKAARQTIVRAAASIGESMP